MQGAVDLHSVMNKTFAEYDKDDCRNNSCKDYQVCVDEFFDYSCECPNGTTGSKCKGKSSSLCLNPFTVGNLLFWENFLSPECLRDSIV